MPDWNVIVTPVTAAIALGGVLVVCLLTSRRQRDQGGAGTARWFGVSMLLAVGVFAPVALPLFFGEAWHFLREASTRVHVVESVPPGFEPIEPDPRPSWHQCPAFDIGITLLAVLACSASVFKSLQPVGRYFHPGGGTLPPADEPALTARVGEIAAKMRIRPPRVLLLGSSSVELQIAAGAGGLVAPILVVTDGLLHRLRADERDAILAHELAHLARHDIWIALGLIVAAGSLAVAASGFVSPLVALALLLALPHGLMKIRGHFAEPACDVRAGRAVGFPAIARALDKIHAAHKLARKGFVGVLVHATQTHPTREVRLAALARAAPCGSIDGFPVDRNTVRQHKFWSRTACAAWLASVAAGVWLGRERETAWIGAALILLVTATPPLLMIAALAGDILAAYRLGLIRIRLPWRLGACVAALALIILTLTWSRDETITWYLLVPAVACACVALLWGRRTRKLESRLDLALRSHDFAEGCRLFATLPKRVRRRPAPRLVNALCRGRVDGIAAAIDELQRLADDKPKFRLARLWLAKLAVTEQPERAIAVAQELAGEIPKDPNPPALEASALRNLGRVDEARAALGRAIALDRNERLHALAATIEVSAGDLDAATASLALAEQHMPGDAETELARAELAIATGSTAEADAALDAAQQAVRRTPLGFLEPWLSIVETRYRLSSAS